MEDNTQIQIEAEPPTTETERPKVRFDEAQQTRVNELIREAMGRAGREARAKAAELEQQVASLTAQLETATAGTKDAAALKADGLKLAKEGLLLSLGAKHSFVKPEQVSKLIGDRVQYDETYKRYTVRNDDGTTLTDATGKPLAVETLVASFASENPHLVRGDVKPGVGSTESRAWSGEPSQDLKTFFGPRSNAKLANELAMKNPQEYRRLRALAVRQGLLK